MREVNEASGVAFLFATHDPRVVARARRVVLARTTAASRRTTAAMSAFALAWRNLVRQRRRTHPDGRRRGVRVRGLRAGGRIHRPVLRRAEGRDDPERRPAPGRGPPRRLGDRGEDARVRVAGRRRARAPSSPRDPAVAAVLPRIDFVGLGDERREVRSLPRRRRGSGARGQRRRWRARSLVAGKYLSGDGGDGVVLGTGLASALEVKPGDSITLMATTPDGVLERGRRHSCGPRGRPDQGTE